MARAHRFLPILLLVLAIPARAADVIVTLDAGGAFVVQDSTGTLERMRVDEATGNVSLNGQLLLHTSGAGNNTFVGDGAGNTQLTGEDNSGFGQGALNSLSSGSNNSAFGSNALDNNAEGEGNSAFGQGALSNNTSGIDNVALGSAAGSNQTVGSHNIYISNAGVAAESGQIKIGNTLFHTRATIAGIHGGISTSGVPVLVNPSGVLGTLTSSIRFKQAVRDMNQASDVLLRLRPVSFRYREEVSEGHDLVHYGLIAEEVAEIAPELVVSDAQGRPHSVRYQLLTPMLLNEVQRQRRLIEQQRHSIATLAERLERLEQRLAPTQAVAGR